MPALGSFLCPNNFEITESPEWSLAVNFSVPQPPWYLDCLPIFENGFEMPPVQRAARVELERIGRQTPRRPVQPGVRVTNGGF